METAAVLARLAKSGLLDGRFENEGEQLRPAFPRPKNKKPRASLGGSELSIRP